MKIIFQIIVFLTLSLHVTAQHKNTDYIGRYGDWMPNGEALVTELELKADGSFKLRTVDYVYPQTFKDYSNEGQWVVEDKEIVLNPMLKRRLPRASILGSKKGIKDSIEIKINHYVELYENEELKEKRAATFDLMTLYFNKKRDYVILTRVSYKEGSCAFAPRIKNRVNVDTTNTFRVVRKDLEKIGLYTYGFQDFLEVDIQDKEADYFEIDVVVPVDVERMPRSKKVIIKGNRAFFYENKGKVDTFWSTPLRKRPV